MTTSELSIDRTYPKRRILLVVALVALGFALRDHLLAAILFALSNLWQMTPIVLAGLLVTAVLPSHCRRQLQKLEQCQELLFQYIDDMRPQGTILAEARKTKHRLIPQASEKLGHPRSLTVGCNCLFGHFRK